MTFSTWIGARCEYCGAKWTAESRGKPLTYDFADDAISCTRGYGCARRRPEHERRGPRSSTRAQLVVRQYLLDGHWYTVEELAALAGVPRARMAARLDLGWHVAEAISPSRVKGRPAGHWARSAIALARAGGSPRRVPGRPDAPRGRPSPIRGISAAARAHGIDEGTLGARVRRLGSLEAALAQGKPRKTKPKTSGLVAAARELGIARETLRRRVARCGSLEAAIEASRARRAA